MTQTETREKTRRKQERLEKELKDTFPASDAPTAVQPEVSGSGAPPDRKSVNSGREKKLAEEIELNKQPPEKLK